MNHYTPQSAAQPGGRRCRLEWVAQRLAMGHASRLSQAVARMRRRPSRRWLQLQALESTQPGERGK